MSFGRTVRKLALWIAALIAVALALGWYLRRNGRDGEEKYRTELVDRGEIVMTVTATGTVSAVTTVQVGSQVSGIISRLQADFNSRVRKGQLIAALDPTPFEAQVEQRRADVARAEVEMRNAEVAFRRQDRLLRDGLTPQSDFDSAQAAYQASQAEADQARAALSQAETNLRYTQIVSPIDGVVVDRQYDVGQTVAASFQAPTLFTIAQDLTRMQVQADVDQSDIGRVQVGQTARFTVDAYPEQSFTGRITQVRLNATVNQNVITYPVIIEVGNPEEKLRPKMTANVSIEVDRVKDVLRLPNAALRFRPTEAAPGEGKGAEAAGRAGGGGRGRGERPDFDQRAAALGEKGGTSGALALQAEAAAGGTAGAGGREQTVYLLDDRGNLQPVAIRTGITDGRHTAVLSGPLQIGERVVTGRVTARAEGTTGRPPGGPRMF